MNAIWGSQSAHDQQIAIFLSPPQTPASMTADIETSPQEPQATASRGSLLIIFLTVFVDLLGFGMVLPLMPVYAKELAGEYTDAQQGWIIGLLMASFSAMQFLFAPAWGRLSDRIGRRPVLMVGLAGSFICYALFAVATVLESLTGLFICRIGAGIAGATISTAQAYIADTTTLEKRAKGMALIGAAFGLGFTFGPLLGAIGFVIDDRTQLSPYPGIIAAGLSAMALLMAAFWLPESLRPGSPAARRKILDLDSIREATAVPSVALLLFAMFVAVFSFANFESTIALLLDEERAEGGFNFTQRDVLLVFAFIGLVLTIAQGLLVRRLAGRISEGAMGSGGALVSSAGFVLLAYASRETDRTLLFVAMSVEVVGFALMTPSLNSLISRRSDPARQGRVLGVAQSVSSLARILGPIYGIRLFKEEATLPFWSAAAMMAAAILLIGFGVKRGRDYEAPATTADQGLAEPVIL